MFSGTWSSTHYYGGIVHGIGTADITTGDFQFTYKGLYNYGNVMSFNIDPKTIVTGKEICVSYNLFFTINRYDSEIISGFYRMTQPFDVGIFTLKLNATPTSNDTNT